MMLIEILFVAIMVALSCASLGIFLVLNEKTMVADAITHTVLLGIVLGFFITVDLDSPLLLIGATIVGVTTVWLIEGIKQVAHLHQDTAIGIVFPFLFSLAVILLTKYASHVHLDVDAVFMGQLGFTLFNRLTFLDFDLGPIAAWRSLLLTLINVGFIAYCYQELKIMSFDKKYAKTIGIPVTLINYILMTLVSLTAVGAFEAVGSILVVAFMVGPALTAYTWTSDLKMMCFFTLIFAISDTIIGASIAYYFNISYSGVIASVSGVVAISSCYFSPVKGYFRKNKIEMKKEQNV